MMLIYIVTNERRLAVIRILNDWKNGFCKVMVIVIVIVCNYFLMSVSIESVSRIYVQLRKIVRSNERSRFFVPFSLDSYALARK